MAESVEIKIEAKDDASDVFESLRRQMDDTKQAMDQLAQSADSLSFHQAVQGASDVNEAYDKAFGTVKQGIPIFGELGHAIMQGLGLGAGLSIFAGITSGIQSLVGQLKSTVTEASAAEEAQTRLRAVLAATGGASGVTAQQVNDLAGEMQNLTRFEDDTVVSASSVMLTFRHINSEVFPRAIKAAGDLAAMWGMDLTSAARMVGRALDAPGEGLGMLTRLGVRFTDEQNKMLQQMVATGQGAQAQAMILDTLNSKFGGTAQAMAGTYAGRLEQLRNKFSDVKEEIGNHLLPMLEMLTERLSRGIDSGGGIVGWIGTQIDDFAKQTRSALDQLDLVGKQISAIGDFANAAANRFSEYWRAAIGIVGTYFERLKAQAAGVWATITGNAAEAARQQGIVADLTASIAAQSANLGTVLSTVAPIMQSAWADMVQELHRLNIEIDIAAGRKARIGPETGLPNTFAGQLAAITGGRLRAAATNAGVGAGEAWGGGFADGVKNSNIPSAIEGDIKAAQEKLKGLVPEMFPDLNAPGANGPFENIFRAADVAKRGEDSPWAKVLGLTQDQAKDIVTKFGQGIIDESVKGLIDIEALKKNAKLKEVADAMTKQFGIEIAGSAGASTELKTAGSTLIGTLKTGVDTAAPGLVDGLKTTITTPIIEAFDAATAAVDRLIAAMERLKAQSTKPPATGGTGGGPGGGAPQLAPLRYAARARGYA